MKNKSVYLMQSGSKVKIGVSENPVKRLNSLRIGCPDISTCVCKRADFKRF